jgi:hypothetical protein
MRDWNKTYKLHNYSFDASWVCQWSTYHYNRSYLVFNMQLSRVFYNKINMKWFGVLKKYSINRNILLSSILLAGVYCNRFFFFNLFFQKQLQSSNIIIKSDEPDKICYNDRYFIGTLILWREFHRTSRYKMWTLIVNMWI